MIEKLKFYLKVAKWLFKHRAEPHSRQKMRRMAKELGE